MCRPVSLKPFGRLNADTRAIAAGILGFVEARMISAAKHGTKNRCHLPHGAASGRLEPQDR
jgi:hypothetical protein